MGLENLLSPKNEILNEIKGVYECTSVRVYECTTVRVMSRNSPCKDWESIKSFVRKIYELDISMFVTSKIEYFQLWFCDQFNISFLNISSLDIYPHYPVKLSSLDTHPSYLVELSSLDIYPFYPVEYILPGYISFYPVEYILPGYISFLSCWIYPPWIYILLSCWIILPGYISFLFCWIILPGYISFISCWIYPPWIYMLPILLNISSLDIYASILLNISPWIYISFLSCWISPLPPPPLKFPSFVFYRV